MRGMLLGGVALVWALDAHAVRRPVAPAEDCARSALVVIGEITGQEAGFSADGSGLIETWSDVQVLRTLRGEADAETLRVVTPGGVAGGLRLTVEHAPELQVDARYLLLLAPRADGEGWRVVGGEEGATLLVKGAEAAAIAAGGCHAP